MDAAINSSPDRAGCGRLQRCIAIFFFSLLIGFPLFADSETDALFQKALVKESVERNLDAAIELYQQTIGNPGVTRAMAGESRLRMGLCYEKLGKPKEAEIVYRQLLDNTANISSDIVVRAKTHLRDVEAQNHLGGDFVPGSSKIVWVSRPQGTPLSFLIGPAIVTSHDSSTAYSFMTGLRWRLSSVDRPLGVYAQVHGTTPLHGSEIQSQLNDTDRFGVTSATLKIRYQTLFGLVAELPHGGQLTVIPEIGAGAALMSSQIHYTNPSFSGTQVETHWGPYLEFGLQLFSNRPLSLLANAIYTPTPYLQSVDVHGLTGSQSFNFPSAQWTLGMIVQWKVSFKRLVPEIQK